MDINKITKDYCNSVATNILNLELEIIFNRILDLIKKEASNGNLSYSYNPEVLFSKRKYSKCQITYLDDNLIDKLRELKFTVQKQTLYHFWFPCLDHKLRIIEWI